MEHEMKSMIIDGKDNKVTFYEFPYYLSKFLPRLWLIFFDARLLLLDVTDFSLQSHGSRFAPVNGTKMGT
ncbi:hypothetical protein Hanom_Chr06g00544981 [Helianthus anomalus]